MPNPIKISLRSEAISIILILASIIASFFFYAHFPDRVATHWDFNNEVNGWSSRAFAAFFFPALILGMYLLFLFLPWLDPKKDRYAEFSKPYNIFKTIMIVFMTTIYGLVGLNGMGYNVNVGLYTPLLVGILFIIIGNYLSKFKLNWFIGMRTPWTLSSEEVWNKSNRFAGKLFILAGILMIAQIFFPATWRIPVFIGMITVVVILPTAYSYWLYYKTKKK